MITRVKCVSKDGSTHTQLVVGKIYKLNTPVTREFFESRQQRRQTLIISLEGRNSGSFFAWRFIGLSGELDKQTTVI